MIWRIFAVLPEIIWSSKSWFALLGTASIILEQLDPRALCQQNSCSKLFKEVLCTGKSEWKLLQLPRPCSAVPGDYRARLNEINIGMILPFYAQTILQLKSKQRFPHAYAKFSVHAMLSWFAWVLRKHSASAATCSKLTVLTLLAIKRRSKRWTLTRRIHEGQGHKLRAKSRSGSKQVK